MIDSVHSLRAGFATKVALSTRQFLNVSCRSPNVQDEITVEPMANEVLRQRDERAIVRRIIPCVRCMLALNVPCTPGKLHRPCGASKPADMGGKSHEKCDQAVSMVNDGPRLMILELSGQVNTNGLVQIDILFGSLNPPSSCTVKFVKVGVFGLPDKSTLPPFAVVARRDRSARQIRDRSAVHEHGRLTARLDRRLAPQMHERAERRVDFYRATRRFLASNWRA